MSIWRDFVVCPYNKNHVIRKYNVPYHIPICKEKHQNVFFLTCRFDCQRLCEEDSEFSCQSIPEIVSSKSKRRRYKIRARREQKPKKPVSNERAVEMDKRQELGNLGEGPGAWGAWGASTDDWQESVKKTSSKKNSIQASNDKAEHSTEDADQRSKAAKKRSQRKQRKEKVAADVVPANKSNARKEYVIRLNESVSVTEANKGRKEVYIHYPTRRLLSPDSVPNSGLGIQPMMLQRICFEAFMRMQLSPNGAGSGITSSVNENRSTTIEGSNETASGVTPSLNEDENNTIQGSSESASGVNLSGIGQEIRTTEASDDILDDDLYYPKRYKPKKDKNSYLENLKSNGPHNAFKLSSLQEIPFRELFLKYMISENDELPPPTPRPDKNSFPPPYLEFEDVEVRGESEGLVNPVEHGDYDICRYLCDDEWPDEKDYESIDENENANFTY